eukprot:262951_1
MPNVDLRELALMTFPAGAIDTTIRIIIKRTEYICMSTAFPYTCVAFEVQIAEHISSVYIDSVAHIVVGSATKYIQIPQHSLSFDIEVITRHIAGTIYVHHTV